MHISMGFALSGSPPGVLTELICCDWFVLPQGRNPSLRGYSVKLDLHDQFAYPLGYNLSLSPRPYGALSNSDHFVPFPIPQSFLSSVLLILIFK